MANRYSKALKHIKKDYSLTEAPTNSMSRVYSLNNPGHQLGPVPNNAKVFVPDIDGNWPAGIPGTPGEGGYTRPAGFWTGERDWDTVTQPNFSHEAAGANGTDTSGLIASNGAVLTALPPNSRSFILGPLVDGHTYLHGSDAYTNIGYIQKDTRQFVLLARVDGQWEAGGYPIPETAIQYGWPESRVWDGTANGFTAYNSNFTLEMAQWFRGEMLGKRFVKEVAYFYSGGVSQPPITGGPASGMYGGSGVGAGGDGSSADGSGSGRGYGSGGEPNIGEPQTDKHGGPEDAGAPFIGGKKKKPKPDRDDYPPGRAGAKKYQDDLNKWKDEQKEEGGEEKPGSEKPDKEPSDYKSPKDRGGQGGNNQPWRDNEGKTGDPAADYTPPKDRGGQGDTGSDRDPNAGKTGDPATDYTPPKDRGGQGDTDGVNPNEPGLLDKAKEAWDWYVDNKEAVDAAAGSVMNAVDAAMAIASVVGVIFPEAGTSIAGALGIASLTSKMKKAYNAVKAGKTVADAIGGKNKGLSGAGSFDVGATGVKKGGFDALNPNQVGPKAQHTGSKGILSPGGGMVYSAPKVGQTGPSAINPGSGASKYTQYGSNPFSQSSKGGGNAGGVIGSIVNKGNKSIGVIEPQSTQTPAQFNKSSKLFNDIMNGKYQNSPTAQKIYQKGIDAGFTGGSGSISHSNIPKQTSVPNAGKTMGSFSKFASKYTPTHGHLGTFGGINYESYLIENNSKKELKLQGDKEDIMIMHLLKKPEILKKLPLIIKGLEQETELSDVYGAMFGFEGGNIKESLSESRKIEILKEIKKPVVLIEASPKMTKLKGYKPNFKGKFSPQNTPEVTACKQSDGLVARANARGQTWRSENKYWQGYETTERMNIIYDRMGHGQQAWDAIIEDARNKNGWKNREIQEQLNQIAHEKAMRKIDPDFKSPWNLNEMEDPNKDEIDKYMNDPLVKRVRKKLLTQIDYKDKPSKKGYPEQPPEKIDPNTGMHPKYGKVYKYDKLDPVSAVSMKNAPTGNPEIDANVEKAAKKKYVKPNVKEEWASDWRDSISYD